MVCVRRWRSSCRSSSNMALRCCTNFLHNIRKCLVVSGWPHSGQLGSSTALMLCRKASSGVCPARSWAIAVAECRGRAMSAFLVRMGSCTPRRRRSIGWAGCSTTLVLHAELIYCFTAERLVGRGTWQSEEVASFAAWSTSSFSVMPT